jgi:hypothetical protein
MRWPGASTARLRSFRTSITADLQAGEKMRPQFLYNTTRSLYEQTGFSYDRPKGKKNCVMRTTVPPVKASRRARVG